MIRDTVTSKTPGTEQAHDILSSRRSPLEPFFTPRSVAVIGATENAGSVGHTVLWNLIQYPLDDEGWDLDHDPADPP
ncbi:MAG: hypothetical protein ACRD8O_16700 [Bryobacteraceae bacterium]